MKIISLNQDGTIGVTACAPGIDPHEEAAKLSERGVNIVGMVVSEIPEDAGLPNWELVEGEPMFVPQNARGFRNCWTYDGEKVVHDVAKVIQCRKDKAREIRNKLLADSDIEMVVANERNLPSVVGIRDYRQSLRDLGTSIDTDPVNIVWPVHP